MEWNGMDRPYSLRSGASCGVVLPLLVVVLLLLHKTSNNQEEQQPQQHQQHQDQQHQQQHQQPAAAGGMSNMRWHTTSISTRCRVTGFGGKIGTPPPPEVRVGVLNLAYLPYVQLMLPLQLHVSVSGRKIPWVRTRRLPS